MSFKATDYGVTVVALEKDNNKYGMACSWMMQVDYDKLVCLLGEQSSTGSVIENGDYIGVSTLSKAQADLALHFGEGHSNLIDKFDGIVVNQINSAIIIPDACREMLCKVIDILHLEGIESDNLVYLQIVESKENNDDFLHYGDL